MEDGIDHCTECSLGIECICDGYYVRPNGHARKGRMKRFFILVQI